MCCATSPLLDLHDCVCEVMIQPRAGGSSNSLPFAQGAPQIPTGQMVSITAICVLSNKPLRNFPGIPRGTEIIARCNVEHGKLVEHIKSHHGDLIEHYKKNNKDEEKKED